MKGSTTYCYTLGTSTRTALTLRTQLQGGDQPPVCHMGKPGTVAILSPHFLFLHHQQEVFLGGPCVPLRTTTYSIHRSWWLHIKLPFPLAKGCSQKLGVVGRALDWEMGHLGASLDPITNRGTLCKSLPLSGSCFPHLQDEDEELN